MCAGNPRLSTGRSRAWCANVVRPCMDIPSAIREPREVCATGVSMWLFLHEPETAGFELIHATRAPCLRKRPDRKQTLLSQLFLYHIDHLFMHPVKRSQSQSFEAKITKGRILPAAGITELRREKPKQLASSAAKMAPPEIK